MTLGRNYKRYGIDGTYDAIVIGSGMGGLTTASLLARHGRLRVLVLERHYEVGGFTHTFRRPGYEWDVGVHYVGQTKPGAPLRRLFDDVTAGQLQWADMGPVYDEIVIGRDRYELRAGYRNFRDTMIGYFPKERGAIDEYLRLVRQCSRWVGPYFAEKLLPDFLSRTVGASLRHPLLRLARRTTREVLESLTDDPRLIAVLSAQYGDYGLPPSQSSFFIHAMVVQHYMGGAAYPVGGSARIAETIVPVIRAAGGQVVTSAGVEHIVFEDGRAVGVCMADGAVQRAPLIVSGAGVGTTYGSLVPASILREHGMTEAITAVEPSVSHATLYLGFDETAEQLGLGKRNIWVHAPGDHDTNFARFVDDPSAPLPFAYLSFASAKDPDFTRRHPGRATVEVVALAPYQWFEPWQDTRWKRRGDDYDALKRDLSDKMLEALFEECPQLRGKVAYQELSSPLSTRHFCNFGRGELYGLAHTPKRFEQRWLRPKTPIPGLYLTGADVSTAGVGGALFGGAMTATAVLGRSLRTVLARRGPGGLHRRVEPQVEAMPRRSAGIHAP
ncbi:MAG: NAD(P)/FAD-dependent oxidoreductase [Deltaproteobacteria bacterium]|nr:NAD(P)/FAD-dependent oxidoreductase [Deltaproteobacteria bacterium]